MGMMIKWVFRELWNNKKFSFFYIFNLTLGLLGLLFLSSFQRSFEKATFIKAKEILSADFSIFARRILHEKELRPLQAFFPTKNFASSRRISLYTMIRKSLQEKNAEAESRLVQLRGIQSNFPFYGQISFRDGKKLDAAIMQELQSKKGLWIFSELADQFQLKVGNFLLIDGQEFSIQRIVEEDSSDLSMGFSLAPRAYVGLDNLLSTKLVSSKSTLHDHRFIKFSSSSPSPSPSSQASASASTSLNLQKLREELEFKTKDNSISFQDPQKAASQVNSTFDRINDYLGLVALVATFLSALGGSYLIQSYVEKKKKSVAILKSIGMTPVKIMGLYLCHLILLGLCASLLSLALTSSLLPQMEKLFQTLFDFHFPLSIHSSTVGLCLLLGVLGGIFVGLPSLIKINATKAHQLLKGDFTEQVFSWAHVIGHLPGLVFLWGLSVFLSHSYFVGTIFFLSLGVSYLGFTLLGWLLIFLLKRVRAKNYILKLTFKGMIRRSWALSSTIVALGLCILLLNLIPILESSLKEEMTQPEGSVIPGLFLFDIQEEQLREVNEFLNKDGLKLEDVSPLISARITKINNIKFDKILEKDQFKTREEERQSWARNRGYNLTYNFSMDEVVSKKEEILEGVPFSGKYQEDAGKPMEISLEYRFAQRLNLTLGDEILFDIQGVELLGKVINLRKVRWTSFRPNFFINVQPGSLDEAPKTFLAAMRAMSSEKRSVVQYQLSKNFPNISIIDVNRGVEKILVLLGYFANLLRGMSLLSLVVGLIILYTIANFEANRQVKEINLLKILGISLNNLRMMTVLHFGLLSVVSCLLGVLLCLGLSFIFSHELFEGSWVIPWNGLLLSSLVIILMSCGVALLSVWKVFRTSCRELF